MFSALRNFHCTTIGRANFIRFVHCKNIKYKSCFKEKQSFQTPQWPICNQVTCLQSYTYRLYSNQARKPGFISNIVDNIKQEIQKNKEMKESLKKFRDEAVKLEQSDALKSARQKFQSVESEANKNSEVLKEKIDSLKEKVSHTFLYTEYSTLFCLTL